MGRPARGRARSPAAFAAWAVLLAACCGGFAARASAAAGLAVLAPAEVPASGELAVLVAEAETGGSGLAGARAVLSPVVEGGAGSEAALSAQGSGPGGLYGARVALPEGAAPGDQFKLSVVGAGGSALLGESTATVTVGESLQLLASLDKPMYQPGQTVRARVLAYDAALLPVDSEVQLTVMDPKGFKIFKATSRTGAPGVAAFEMPLASEATLGEYTVVAETDGVATEALFELQKYKLPRFEVVVELDQSLLTSDARSETQRVLSGQVKAAYTYGKPVRGTVSIAAREVNSFMPWMVARPSRLPGPGGGVSRKTTLASIEDLAIDGTASFEFDIGGWKAKNQLYAGQKVNVTAVVTDEATGDVEDGEVVIDVVAGGTDVTLTADEFFKPSLPLKGEISAKDAVGAPAPGTYKAEVTLQTQSWSRNPTVFEQDVIVGDSGQASFEMGIPLDGEDPKCCDAAALAGEKSSDSRDSCCITRLDLILYRISGENSREQVARKCVTRSFSPSMMYLSARLQSDPETSASASSGVSVAVTTSGVAANETFIPAALHYTVTTREGVSSNGSRPWKVGDAAMSLNVPVEPSWSPEARIFVFFVAPSGEVVGDTVVVSGLGRQLDSSAFTAQFTATSARPGEAVNIAIQGGNHVYLRSVDTSMKLLSDKDTGVTTSGVSQRLLDFLPDPLALAPLDSGLEQSGTAGGKAAESAGFVLSSSNPRTRPLWYGCQPVFYDDMVFAEAMPMVMPAVARAGAIPEDAASPPANADSVGTSESVRVRKFFPETWIWTDTTCNAGDCSIETVVPDTITSWELDAFSMGSKDGLRVALPTEPLTVFKPFFSLLNLPRVVKRREWLEVSATVFNYGSQGVVAQTSLKLPDSILSEGPLSQSVFIQEDSSETLYFNISATSVGTEDILFTAQVVQGTGVGSDAVQRPLEVEAEGLAQEKTTNAILDPSETSSKSVMFETFYPEDAVESSAHASVAIVGDLLGPTLDGLDRLVRLPTGCGEQTMITFAPQIFVMNYLDSVGSNSPDLRKNLQSNIAVGLQRELTYRHSDGSFSAFGESDKSGSTWLTAFVLKTFSQAGAYTFVDSEVLANAAEFILNAQDPDGSFQMIGKVIHEDMMGGVSGADGKVSLTSFCLVALLEAAEASDTVTAKLSMFDKPLERAVAYLLDSGPLVRGTEREVTEKEKYAAAISAYALSLARSYRASLVPEEMYSAAMSNLEGMGVKEDGLMHWGSSSAGDGGLRPVGASSPEICPRWSTHCGSNSAAVETTAYALLAILSKANGGEERLAEALPAARWLIQKRNSNGGFRSTQDTVVGLESLSDFSTKAYQDGVALDVKVSSLDSDFEENVRVSMQNRDVVQRLVVPLGERFRATSEGSGQAAISSTVEYHVVETVEKPAFNFSVSWSSAPTKAARRRCKARVDYAGGGGKGGMAVMELGLFTGTAVAADSLAALRLDPRVKRLEVEPSKLVLYFDEISSQGETVELETDILSPVVNLQPASSVVYEYYQPENQALTLSRSDDSTSTFLPKSEEEGDLRVQNQLINQLGSSAGAVAPKLFSAAMGAALALLALV